MRVKMRCGSGWPRGPHRPGSLYHGIATNQPRVSKLEPMPETVLLALLGVRDALEKRSWNTHNKELTKTATRCSIILKISSLITDHFLSALCESQRPAVLFQ